MSSFDPRDLNPATRGDLFAAVETALAPRPSPFVGHRLFIWNSPTAPVGIDGPVECLDHVGSHLLVKDPDGKTAWINLNVIPSVEFRDDGAPTEPRG
jgi:hypothetical protein